MPARAFHRAEHTASLASLLVALLLPGFLAACGAGATPTATAAPTPPAATATPAGPTDVPGASGRTAAPAPDTFATAWGEAWDGLPDGFPLPAGATPADPPDPADGPVSGAFVVEQDAQAAADLIENGLVAAGYSTEAIGGPAEDGSIVIDSVGSDADCRVQTRVRPLGGTTMIAILFGAACPWR